MSFRFFSIPAKGCSELEQELNQLLNSIRVLSVDRRFVELGENSYWAICVDFLDGTSIESKERKRRASVDYREILSDDDFRLYSLLRDLRKTIADAEAIPVYNVFTNEQLAKIVQLKVSDRASFKQIDGIGEGRIQKYADRFLDFIQQQKEGSEDEKNR